MEETKILPWTAQPVPGSMFMEGVSCPRPQRCEAAGQDSNGDFAAFGTADGGQTWTQQTISPQGRPPR